MTKTYLAILEPAEGGGFGVYFPDIPGCISYGETIAQARNNAEEAANLHLYDMENDHEELPEPSEKIDEIMGKIAMPVTVNLTAYRLKRENERVKTNTTLPAWLKNMAEEKQVNYSRLLESALISYLNIG